MRYFDNENKDEEHCILFIHGNSIDCGIFNPLLNDLMTCEWVNEVELVQNLGIIPAIINGAEDPFINTEYIEGLNLRLFEEGVIQIEGAGHCGIYTHAKSFTTKIAEYVNTLALF